MSARPNTRVQTAPAIVIGRDEYGRTVAIDAAGTPHVALQGASRAGKSSATYTLLAALAHRPDVIVCGVDPSGILLDPFARGRGGAYIATGTRAEDLDAAADTLARLVNLMDDRIAALLRRGEDKISTFTAALPAVWVVMEEFPGLLAAARALDAERGPRPGNVAPRLERSVSRLIKESAKVGFTVLILAQRMSANALDTDDRSNIAVRITLRVDNGDAVAMLHDGMGPRRHRPRAPVPPRRRHHGVAGRSRTPRARARTTPTTPRTAPESPLASRPSVRCRWAVPTRFSAWRCPPAPRTRRARHEGPEREAPPRLLTRRPPAVTGQRAPRAPSCRTCPGRVTRWTSPRGTP